MAGPFPHQAAFDVIDDGILIYDPDTGALLDVNERMCALSGYTRPELLARDDPNFVADTLPAGPVRLRALIRRGADLDPVDTLWHFHRKDGSLLCTTLRLRRGSFEGAMRIVVIVREASTLSDDKANCPSYDRLQEVLRTLPVYIFEQDRDLRYTWVNNTLPGIDQDDLLGCTEEAILSDEQAQRLQAIKRCVMETNTPTHITYWATVGEQRYHLDTYLVPRRDATGTVAGLVGAVVDITEHRHHEEQLHQLAETVSEYAIFMLDPKGHVVSWNAGAERIKGYTEEEILGRPLSTFYPPDEATDVPKQMLDIAARDGQWIGEGWRIRKDGSRFWALATITALRDQDGQLRGFTKVTRDLTERRQRENALRESERRYRRLFEEAQEGIAITAPDGKIVDVNPAGLAMIGYTKADLERLNAADLYVDPEDRRRGAKRLTESGAVRDFEVLVRRKDRSPIVCRLSSTIRRGRTGAIEAYQTFFRDITDEKRARAALEESEAKFRTLAEEALVGIALLQDEVYQYVNPAFARIMGYAPDEIIGRSPAMLFHPDDWPPVQEDLKKRFSGETREAHYEARIITRSGELRVIEVMGHRFIYQDKPSIIGTVLDVTDQRRLEERLLKIQEEERQRIGRELHDGVASELTGAGIMTTVMTRKAQRGHTITPEELAQISGFIKNSAQEIRMLSRGLSPVRLDRGLATALEALVERTQMRSKHLDCTFEATGAATVLAEETATHLYRIAQEAIGNAVKHANAQRIQVRLVVKDDALVLTVRDDGRGGIEHTLPSQEGLGMRTMHYRSHLMGSVLTIAEAPDGGTLVRCRLPAASSR